MNFYRLKKLIVLGVASVTFSSIAFADSGTVTGNSVRLRTEPTVSSKVLTLLSKGTSGEIITKTDSGWFQISTGSNIGWISSDYFKKNETATPAPTYTTTSENKTVVVCEPIVNIRKEATTSSEILAQFTSGQLLKVSAKVSVNNDTWYQVEISTGRYGFIRADLTTSDMSKMRAKGTVSGAVVNLREASSTSSTSICKITYGTEVVLLGLENGWYRVTYNGKTGYMYSEYITASSTNTITSRSGSSTTSSRVVELATNKLGKSYSWGAAGPNSFDCSGFSQYIFKQVGITLNRTSSSQATQGIKVARSELQTGDLLFFKGINSKNASISHVGIYVGNSSFIHASTPSTGVIKSSLNESYYSSHYVTARRVIR